MYKRLLKFISFDLLTNNSSTLQRDNRSYNSARTPCSYRTVVLVYRNVFNFYRYSYNSCTECFFKFQTRFYLLSQSVIIFCAPFHAVVYICNFVNLFRHPNSDLVVLVSLRNERINSPCTPSSVLGIFDTSVINREGNL